MLWQATILLASTVQWLATVDSWLERGEREFAARDFASARSSFDQAIAASPNNFLAFRARGLCELELRDFNAAYRDWLKASELNADDLRTKYYLGRLFYEADLPQQAAVYLRKVVEQSPSDFAALTYLGLSAEATGYDETARDLYRKAIYESNSQSKPFSWAYLALANWQVKHGDEKAAIVTLTEGETRCPEAQLLATLGDLLSKSDDKAHAETVLRRAIQLDNSLSRAHYRLALVLKSSGQQEEARHEMQLFAETKGREAALPKPQALRR